MKEIKEQIKDELTFHEKIIAIQSEILVPKEKRNEFGKFGYRNLADIMAALKPLLKKYGLFQKMENRIEVIENIFFLTAEVSISDGVNIISATAQAKHPLAKSGMDDMQITGACSSYARKYAWEGLLGFDNNKDADALPQPKNITRPQADELKNALLEIRDLEGVKKFLDIYKVDSFVEISTDQLAHARAMINKVRKNEGKEAVKWK